MTHSQQMAPISEMLSRFLFGTLIVGGPLDLPLCFYPFSSPLAPIHGGVACKDEIQLYR